MAHLRWLTTVAGAAFATSAYVQAADFATRDEVAKRSFPDASSFREMLIVPTADDQRALSALGQGNARSTPWRILVAYKGEQALGWLVADAVIGKYELIDYAVAVGQDGRIHNLEILSYRESHGYEVKLPAWRNQFTGKGGDAKLRVGEDIANISGATLSCTHITDGVRRIVVLLDRLRASARL